MCNCWLLYLQPRGAKHNNILAMLKVMSLCFQNSFVSCFADVFSKGLERFFLVYCCVICFYFCIFCFDLLSEMLFCVSWNLVRCTSGPPYCSPVIKRSLLCIMHLWVKDAIALSTLNKLVYWSKLKQIICQEHACQLLNCCFDGLLPLNYFW